MKFSLPLLLALLNKKPYESEEPQEAGAESGCSALSVSLSHLREAKQPAKGWPSMCLQSPAAVGIYTQPAWRCFNLMCGGPPGVFQIEACLEQTGLGSYSHLISTHLSVLWVRGQVVSPHTRGSLIYPWTED